MRFDQLTEDEMSDAEKDKREKIVKGMKKNKADLKKRYGDRWEEVMYATATKRAMDESNLNEYSTMPLTQQVSDLLNRGEQVFIAVSDNNVQDVIDVSLDKDNRVVTTSDRKRYKINNDTHHIDYSGGYNVIRSGTQTTNESKEHTMKEEQLNEGVLDGADDEGFVVRSQLYVLAREAIKLHSMIGDQDMIDPTVQDMVLNAMNNINMASQALESDQLALDSFEDDPTIPPMDEAWGMNGGARRPAPAKQRKIANLPHAPDDEKADAEWERRRAAKAAKKKAKPSGLRALFADVNEEEQVEVDVVFRKFPDGDVIALFPNERYGKYIMSYEHIGQHSEASPALIDELEPATEVEYADLLDELKRIGYIPLIIESCTESKHPGWKASSKMPKAKAGRTKHPAKGLVGEAEENDDIKNEATNMIKSLKAQAQKNIK